MMGLLGSLKLQASLLLFVFLTLSCQPNSEPAPPQDPAQAPLQTPAPPTDVPPPEQVPPESNSAPEVPVTTLPNTREPSPEVIPARAFVLNLLEVSENGCINLEKLRNIFSSPEYQYPASQVTINFKPLNFMTPSRREFHAFSVFDYRLLKTGEIIPFSEFSQEKCKEILIKHLNGDSLHYKLESSEPNKLKLVRQPRPTNEKPSHFVKAIDNRAQVDSYEFLFDLEKSQLTLIMGYIAPDSLCNSDNQQKLWVEKLIVWRSSTSELPLLYKFDPEFLTSVRAAALVEDSLIVNSDPPELLPELSPELTVEQIQMLSQATIREELLKCRRGD